MTGDRADLSPFRPDRYGVVFAQRFGGALNLNLHFRALVIDGICASPFARPVFHAAPPLEDHDVEELIAILRRRILR